MPVTTLIRVDLPLPDLPTMETKAPDSTTRSMPSRAVNFPAALWYTLTTPRNRTSWLSLVDAALGSVVVSVRAAMVSYYASYISTYSNPWGSTVVQESCQTSAREVTDVRICF